MVARKEAIHCKKHVPRTAEWVANQAASIKGRKLSNERRLQMSTIRRGPQPIDRSCEYCKTPFTVEKPSRKQRFCSRECGYKNRRGEKSRNWDTLMPIVTCGTCQKTFRAKTKSVEIKFCCLRCSGIARKRRQKNKHTDIEILLADSLKSHNINFLDQYVIPSVGIPDFYIPSMNAVVFCDGDYWHSLPEHKNRDAEQNSKLKSLGFFVARFWGKEIKASPDACVQRLLNSALHCSVGK